MLSQKAPSTVSPSGRQGIFRRNTQEEGQLKKGWQSKQMLETELINWGKISVFFLQHFGIQIITPAHNLSYS